MKTELILAICGTCTSAFLRGAVADETDPAPVTPVLVSEADAIVLGESIWIGLWMAPADGYHTYWKGPGIVGLATQLSWELPAGFSAGEIVWPAPERVKMARINAHGYRRPVLLMVEVTTPDDGLEVGTEVRLKAEAAWMCCSQTCHPGFADLEIVLPVREGSMPTPVARRFADARETVPVAIDGWVASASREEEDVVLQLTPEEGMVEPSKDAEIYFFNSDGQVHSDEPQLVERSTTGGIELRAVWSEFGPETPDALPGLL